jgi:hypothetical protein
MRQAGAALLMMMAILAIGMTSFMVAALNQAESNSSAAAQSRNAAVLAEAKSALIGHVVRQVLDLSENIPGRLPCPESPSDAGTANEGRAGSACSPTFPTNKTIGRLPWRTLGVAKLLDSAGEPLWYVVSPNWVLSTPNPPPVINAGTPGQLSVDGVADVVAVIIAPGRPLVLAPTAAQVAQGCQPRAQMRDDRGHNPAGASPDYRNYVECQNASSPIDGVFGTAVADNATNLVINDHLVTVTSRELLNAMQGPLAERMQRTVAPLLREYSGLWPNGTFLPYAAPFVAPEGNLPASAHCGPPAPAPQVQEGLLPIATTFGNCASNWSSFNITGSVTALGCASLLPVSTDVRCSFAYYRLNALGQLVLGAGATATDVTIEATAPRAAASFRRPLAVSDIVVPAGVAVKTATLKPQTDGDARLTLVATISESNVCDDLVLGIVCAAVGGWLTTPQTVEIDFPQLVTPTLQGTKLAPAVRAVRPPPYNLLNPLAGEPHYWFIENEWYRYTYYVVSSTSSAAGAGGHLTIRGFPPANGNASDKRFVLASMGPALAGQVRGSGAALANYIEGDNAATAASPRVFAYQVYAASGNDRIATCPFNDGTASACD